MNEKIRVHKCTLLIVLFFSVFQLNIRWRYAAVVSLLVAIHTLCGQWQTVVLSSSWLCSILLAVCLLRWMVVRFSLLIWYSAIYSTALYSINAREKRFRTFAKFLTGFRFIYIIFTAKKVDFYFFLISQMQ